MSTSELPSRLTKLDSPPDEVVEIESPATVSIEGAREVYAWWLHDSSPIRSDEKRSVIFRKSVMNVSPFVPSAQFYGPSQEDPNYKLEASIQAPVGFDFPTLSQRFLAASRQALISSKKDTLYKDDKGKLHFDSHYGPHLVAEVKSFSFEITTIIDPKEQLDPFHLIWGFNFTEAVMQEMFARSMTKIWNAYTIKPENRSPVAVFLRPNLPSSSPTPHHSEPPHPHAS